MKLERFFEKFEQFADAPNAVAKMRELVLQLAINGKLVGLDSAKWERVQLGTLGEWGSGGTPLRSEPQYYGGAIPWLVIGDLNDGFVTSASSFITEEGLANSSARLLPKGVLLIAMYGSIGKLGITGIECATNQAIAFCKPTPNRADLKYLFYTIKAIQPALLARGQGLAQKNISQTILKAWEIDLPPLAEQKRIVAKVDELMALCDRLEAQQQERDTRHAALSRASLARFAEAPTPANLDFLFHPSYTITPADLRKSILTLAVQGKLVPQDPNDEPAGELLQRVVTYAKMRGASDEISPSFDIPESWEWVRLPRVLTKLTDGTHHSPPNVESGEFKYVTAKNIKSDGILLGGITYVTKEIHEEIYSRCNPSVGDLLYIKDGATTGIATINQLDEPFSMLSSVALLKPNDAIFNRYLLWVMRSPFFYEETRGSMKGAAITRVTLSVMAASILPLPPLTEQHRIVAKVDQLMALVDQLETQLAASRATAERLTAAVVAELTTQE